MYMYMCICVYRRRGAPPPPWAPRGGTTDRRPHVRIRRAAPEPGKTMHGSGLTRFIYLFIYV